MRHAGRYLTLILMSCWLSNAQTVSSSVNGVLLDASGGAVPRAACKLTNEETGSALNVRSESDGLFTFPTVGAGTYRLDVHAIGFNALSLSHIMVLASERHALGNLQLRVGSIEQAVEVTAQTAALQLSSAEHSGTVSGGQLNDL